MSITLVISLVNNVTFSIRGCGNVSRDQRKRFERRPLAPTIYMNIKRIILIIFLILSGIFMFVYGEYDDSPGGQLIGLLEIIFAIVVLIKSKKKE